VRPEALQSGDGLLDRIRALTEGRGADHVIEAVGLPALQELALAAARPGGTITLAGLSAMGTATNLPGAVLVRQEKTVKGATMAPSTRRATSRCSSIST